MTNRKQTPDVLAEMLGGTIPGGSDNAVVKAKPIRERSAPSHIHRGRKRQTLQWDYIIVTFQDHRGWRPRFENGKEYLNWMQLPLMHEYLNQLASDGWELVSTSAGEPLYGITDKRQLFFRRQKV